MPGYIAIQFGVVALRRGLLVALWPFRPLLGSCCGHVVMLQRDSIPMFDPGRIAGRQFRGHWDFKVDAVKFAV